MGRKGSSYETLLKTYNRYRGRENKTRCECGKTLYPCQMDRHMQTKIHKTLMEQKEIYKEYLVKELERKKNRLEIINEKLLRMEQEKESLVKEKEEIEKEQTS